MSKLLLKCVEAGLKMTDQRKVILKVLEVSGDHPSVDTIYDRAKEIDPSISIATVYRTLSMLQELGLVVKHDFGGSYARFEVKEEHDHEHHHHLIDTETGQVIEFHSEELEVLIQKISEELGYKVIDHTFEIFGNKIKK